MRNWNTLNVKLSSGVSLYCEPTYEELKRVRLFMFCPRRSRIASLPMRNWNSCNKNRGRFCLLNCEPTYEELKQDYRWAVSWSSFWLRAYLWGIETDVLDGIRKNVSVDCEPTYEELKLNYLSNNSLSKLNCEPTYEELKLSPKSFLSLSKTTLRAYLWGIETTNAN